MHGGVPIFVYNKAKMFALIQNSKWDKIPWLWPRFQRAIHGIQELVPSWYKLDIFVFSHYSLYKQAFGKHQTELEDLENPCQIWKKNTKLSNSNFHFQFVSIPNKCQNTFLEVPWINSNHHQASKQSETRSHYLTGCPLFWFQYL